MLVFSLAGIYAKGSEYGVDELTLSSKNGRKKEFKAKCISGNLFAVTAYLIFAAVLMLEHGSIASLHGWNASAQVFWYDCIYNITVGGGAILQFLGGLFGCIVIANLVMMLSAVTGSGKAGIIAALAILYAFCRFYPSYGMKKIFNPVCFGNNFVAKDGMFIGEILVPCICVTFVLALLYITVFEVSIRGSAKRYHIGGRR